MANKFLDQGEIDALLNGSFEIDEPGAESVVEPARAADAAPAAKDAELALTPHEIDALGEIANISMGSGATALSELINHKVEITDPQVIQVDIKEFLSKLPTPHLAINIQFISGLEGSNLLVISNRDSGTLARMMMGEDPYAETEYLDEIQISAASEAMNQMIASAATAMSQMFQISVNISPPEIKPFDQEHQEELSKQNLVIIRFNMVVGDILKTELFQMMPTETAKEQIKLLFEATNMSDIAPPQVEKSAPPVSEERPPAKVDQPHDYQPLEPKVTAGPVYSEEEQFTEGNLDLILDIPLTVSVVLGRTKKPIQEILLYQSGSIVELNRLVEEPVDIMVNDVLVARGEVVVINDNFGVRITNIIHPKERIAQLRSGALI